MSKVTDSNGMKSQFRQHPEFKDQPANVTGSMPGLIYSLRLKPDGSTAMPFATDAIKDVFGLSPKDVSNDFTPIMNLVHPEDYKPVQKSIAESANKMKAWHKTFRVRHPKKREIWIEGHSVPKREPDGSILWQGFMQDITEKKKSEESHALLSAIIKSSTDVIISFDLNGIILSWNQSAERMFGYSSSESIGRNISTLLSPEYVKLLEPNKTLVISGEEVATFNATSLKKNGDRISTQVYLSAIYNSKNHITGIAAIIHDITEHKLAELCVRESEERFYRIFNDSKQPSMLIEDGCFIDANQATLNMLGYDSLKEFLGTKLEDISPKFQPDGLRSSEKTNELIEKAFAEGSQRFEWEYIRKDHSHFYVEVLLTPIQFGNQSILHVVWTDMTEHKLIEEKLKNSRKIADELLARLQKIAVNVPGVMYQYQQWPDGRASFPYASPGIKKIYGVTPEEVVKDASPVFKALHPDDLERVAIGIKKSMETLTNWHDTYRSILPNGKVIWLEGESSPETMPDGSVLWHGYIHDISERRRDEQQLKESEERFRKLFNDSRQPLMLTKEKSFIDVNQATVDLLGYNSREELIESHPDNISPEYQPDGSNSAKKIRENIIKAIALGNLRFEWELARKDGSRITVEIMLTSIRTENGSLLHAALTNITEYKQAEQALRESQIRLELALNATDMGTWDWYVQTGRTVFNKRWALMLGYTLAELKPINIQTWRDLCHPDDLDRSKTLLQQHFAGKNKIFECEIRMHHKKGHWIWVIDRGKVVEWDTEGRPLRMSGTQIDITKRKHAEQELRESEARLKDTQNLARLGGWELDLINNHLIWTEEIFRIFEIDQAKFGASYEVFLEAVHPEDRELVNQTYLDSLQTRQPYELVHRLLMADGRVKYVRELCRTYYENDQPIRSVGTVQDITEIKKAENALLESEAQFRSLIEAAPDAIFVECGGVFKYVNKAMMNLVGATRAEDLLGHSWIERLAPSQNDDIQEIIALESKSSGVIATMELNYLHHNGSHIPVELTAVAFRYKGENGLLFFMRDITSRLKAEAEQNKLEAQLQQAQKMESIGRLAGGVAHDFNNMLLGISLNAELCRDSLPDDHKIRPQLEEIVTDVQRSASITRQLLTFARKQAISPVVLNLNDHVERMLKLLRRLIGENIELVWHPGTQEASVKMDPSQVDQILANLAVNSRDAIEEIGTLTVETDHISLDEVDCINRIGAKPGDYIMLVVSDSGCGMDQETKERIFEPFFTTKEPGKGTGLGLATVYGIIQQNQGFVNVYSEPGKGTTFRIYFPWCDDNTTENYLANTKVEISAGSETILLVEDEKSVRVTTGLLLQSLGYKVITASEPKEALNLIEKLSEPVHLLITDVIMPGMSGRDLAKKLSKKYPDLPCLYISGYTADVIMHNGVLDEGIQFLSKPFTRYDLAQKVLEVLKSQKGTPKKH